MLWPELTAALDELRLARAETLNIAESLSPILADKRLRTGTWSALEILDHILVTEVAFRKYLNQAMDRARTGAIGTIRIGFREVDTRVRPFPRSWGPALAPLLYALHAVVPFNLRLRVMRKPGPVWAGAPRMAEPRGGRTLNELRADLATEMRTTAAMFEGDLPDALPHVRASHPLYGSNNMPQVLRLMAVHEQRHQYQLRKLLNNRTL